MEKHFGENINKDKDFDKILARSFKKILTFDKGGAMPLSDAVVTSAAIEAGNMNWKRKAPYSTYDLNERIEAALVLHYKDSTPAEIKEVVDRVLRGRTS